MIGGAAVQGDPERDREIARAMASATAAIGRVGADPDRPAFHYRAPALWMNDPNGPIFYKGWYHVFYQFNPYGDRWGNMHWGHARSRDLVDWEDLPIALWPSKSRGEDAIFSGSCFLAPGPLGPETPTAFYTSIGDKRPPEQWSAAPEDDDLVRWRKSAANPVLTSDLQEWRDPFLFSRNGATYLITGGGKDGHAIVALYKARDAGLQHWEYQGILFHYPDPDVPNIECPNLAQVGEKWVLLVSVRGRVESFVGDLDGSMRFHVSSRGMLDEGSYASQLLHDRHGKVIHLAWVPTDDHTGWNGFLTLPSVLSVSSNGVLVREPIPELRRLRGERFELRSTRLEGELDLSPKVSGDLLEVVARVEFKGAKEFGVKLRRSPDGSHAVTLRYAAAPGELKVHLFLDRGVVDEYGARCRTAKFSAKPEDLGISVFSEGGTAVLRSLQVYRLHGARFDRSRYR